MCMNDCEGDNCNRDDGQDNNRGQGEAKCGCVHVSTPFFFILLPHNRCIGVVQIELTVSGSSTSVKGRIRPFRFKLDCSDGQVQSA